MKTIKSGPGIDEPVTRETLARAIEQGKQRRSPRLQAKTVSYVKPWKLLLIEFGDNAAVGLKVGNYPEFSALRESELKQLSLGYGGSAICLESRDLHVSIAGLLSASGPFMDMASSLIAARNGSRSSAMKAAASRENGLKGGRPKKVRSLAEA